jgi:hypothetical protein
VDRSDDVVGAAEELAGVFEALGERWYADETMIRDAIRRCSSFNVIRNKRMVKVDVFVPPNVGLHAAKWSRARSIRLGPASKRAVAATSAEDILLQKLV